MIVEYHRKVKQNSEEDVKMIRRIIQIDKEKCNGCGACAQACHEGAIAMVDGKAKLIRNLLTLCAGKNLQLSRRMMHTSPKRIRKRLLSYFSECIKRNGSYTFDIPYNRQQLADYLSVERSAMSAELSKMRKDGIIDFCKNKFCLKKNNFE